MKTLDLSREQITLEELLKKASAEPLRIITPDGHAFVLEDVSDFDEEVELLSRSKKFRRFLSERSKEAATTSLEDYRQSLD